MHEASIVRDLLEAVGEVTPPGSLVRGVRIRVGLLTGVSPDAMQFYFEALREGTVAQAAELEVCLAPIQAACRICGSDCELQEPVWSCPRCGSPLSFKNGNELDLVSVEVDDAPSDNDRGEDPPEEQ